MDTTRLRPFGSDSLMSSVWFPAVVITLVNIALFWALLANVGR